MKALRLAALAACMLVVVSLHAQQIPVETKFGKVSNAELEMAVYPLDTTATAVMLYEKTQTDILTSENADFTIFFSVYERIKVLKEDGKSMADYRITYSGDTDDHESVSGIKVVTWNLEDGKVRKSKLDKQYIFWEKVTDGVLSVSFSAPDVRVGSVIEVSYEIRSDRFWDVGTIDLQRNIPINLIDASFSWPSFLEFNRIMRGRLQPAYRMGTEQRLLNPTSRQPYNYQLYTDYYKNTDVPAIKKDRHSYCPEQYKSAVDYDLSRLNILGFIDKSFAQKWEDVDKQLRDSPIVKECKAKNRKQDEYKALVEGIEDENAVIATVRKAVMQEVKWNNKRGFYPESASKLYKDGVGSAASINALTAGILNGLGYRTEPVMVKLRSNGAMLDFHVRMDAFDTFILRVTTPSGAVHYLDAAPDNGYLDVLWDNYLVEKARVIPQQGSCYWVDLSNLTRNPTVFRVVEHLDGDGEIAGEALCISQNQESAALKQYHSRYASDDEFAESLELNGIEITSIDFKGDPFTPIASMSYKYEREATASGDMMYLQPFIRPFHAEGDFSSPTRDIPVEFAYTEALNYSYQLEIPENYAVEELPRSVRINGIGMTLTLQCKASDPRHITLQFSFNRSQVIYPETSYADLRAFWEQLCNIYKTTIVLKRVS